MGRSDAQRQLDAKRQRAYRERKKTAQKEEKEKERRQREEEAAIRLKRQRADQTRERRFKKEALNKREHELRAAKNESIKFFDDSRRFALFQEYDDEYQKDPETHSSRNGAFAAELFQTAKPAIPGEHYLYQSEKKNTEYLSNPTPLMVCIIDDAEFMATRPPGSMKLFRKELEMMDPATLIDIQNPNKRYDEDTAEKWPVSKVFEQWHRINMLELRDFAIGPWPRGLIKHNTLLSQAIEMSYYDYERLYKSTAPDLGKRKEGVVATDITSSVQFRLCAAPGAVTRWHMDTPGVWTYIFLYGNDSDVPEGRGSAVKYWAIIPMHLHSNEMRKIILDDFARSGQNFVARPEYMPVIISLINGQGLVMPPGTLHAALSLTDCYARGGMSWGGSTASESVRVWKFLAKHPDCTNEYLQRQSRGILKHLWSIAKHDPAQFKLDPNGVKEFREDCEFIASRSLKCRCSKGCGPDCNCTAAGQPCGPKCHPKKPCSNKLGQVTFD